MMPKDCFISNAPDLSFGGTTPVSTFTTMDRDVGARYTLNATYTISFNNGNNSSGDWRRMLSGASAIQYNLYKPGNSTVQTISDTQTDTDNDTTQNVSYQVIAGPAQSNIPTGTYSDVVRAALAY